MLSHKSGIALAIFTLIQTTALLVGTSQAAVYRSPNFVVHAASQEVAEKVGLAAEEFRRDLAIAWLGNPMKRWYKPCPIRVTIGHMGAGGATSFSFDRGEVFGWRMDIQGSLERVLDSVLPHEITHTILACHFRRPLPRWADEGACTLIEHDSERMRQIKLLEQTLSQGNRIPLRRLFAIKEYPSDARSVYKLYAQGYSVVDFLVQQGGRAQFLDFMEDALERNDWDRALKQHYGFGKIESLEEMWMEWVTAGSPRVQLPEGTLLAQMTNDQLRGITPTVRGQSPETDPAPTAIPFAETSNEHGNEHSLAAAPAPVTETPKHQLIGTNAGNEKLSRSRQGLIRPIYEVTSKASNQVSRPINGVGTSTKSDVSFAF